MEWAPAAVPAAMAATTVRAALYAMAGRAGDGVVLVAVALMAKSTLGSMMMKPAIGTTAAILALGVSTLAKAVVLA